MSSTSRRASQTRNSPASKRYIRGEDVSAAVMGVDRFDVDADMNEADEATSTQTGLQRGEHPGEDPLGRFASSRPRDGRGMAGPSLLRFGPA